MRWASQAIVIFGLLALFTAQVERSSAAALPSGDTLVAYSAVDEPPSVEVWSSDESRIGDAARGLLARVKARLAKLRDRLREEIERIKKEINEKGFAEKAKEVIDRITARLNQIKNAARAVAEALGDNRVGAKAREIVKKVDEIIAKIGEKINGKGSQNESVELEDIEERSDEEDSEDEFDEEDLERIAYSAIDRVPDVPIKEGTVKRMTEAVLRDIAKIDDVSSGPHAKENLKKIKARLIRTRGVANTIAKASGNNEVVDAARKLVKIADEGIAKVDAKIARTQTTVSEGGW